jgi:hypothetical protein
MLPLSYRTKGVRGMIDFLMCMGFAYITLLSVHLMLGRFM